MIYYLQVQPDNIITDCITYEYDNYIKWEGEINEPIHGGWFKLIDGQIVEVPELKPLDL